MEALRQLEKEYLVRTYEGDRNEKMRLITLFNIFQDMADNHASKLGVGLEFCLQNGVAWVGSGYHVKIERMPRMGEKIRVKSWASGANKFTAIRDFMVIGEDGEVLVRASSQWILISVERKRPLSLTENLPEYFRLEERALETDFPKIEDLGGTTLEKIFEVRFDDIDINNHVNNAVYPLWASEAVEKEFRLNHEPTGIEVSFKKEVKFGESVKVLTEMKDLRSVHSIKAVDDNRELARVRIEWR